MTDCELADLLISSFDRHRALSVEQALSEALRSTDVSTLRSDAIAFDHAAKVLRLLRRRRPEELPFRFADSDLDRLVGKERKTWRDTVETTQARRVWGVAEALLDHLTFISPDDFEVVCAAAVALAGGKEMRALCTGDEGGIDFYGRLPVRDPEAAVSPGLVFTTILPRPLLVLGQSKRYRRDVMIGRPELQTFRGQVEDCLEKYEGNDRPPSHRVPESFYTRGEPVLGVFVTTAGFAETAGGSAASSGIHLVDGVRIAQFLAYRKVGVTTHTESAVFDREAFSNWLTDQRFRLQVPH